MKTPAELAQDTVLKWTSDKNVSIRMHGGILTGNDILLTDCIEEAITSDRAHYEEKLKHLRDLILDDVPHQYQQRLLEVLK